MGNVHAASAPAGAMPPPPPPSLTPLPADYSAQETPKRQPESTTNPSSNDGIENPGTMEDLHKQFKDVLPVNFEGAKLLINKFISNHFQVSHTINMTSFSPPGYRFGATYVGSKQFSPSDAFPILIGDMDPSGNLNANIIHQFTPNIRTKCASQVLNNKFVAVQVSTDVRGPDYTASLTVANPDIINGSGIYVGHYLQSVTKSTALGAELAYQHGPTVPAGEMAMLSGAARYTGKDFTVSGTVGSGGIHVCYFQKASEQLSIGVDIDTNFRMQESTAQIAYQLDLPKADLVFRGMVDTNMTVGAVLEKKLMPLPFSFVLSGLMNHNKNQFRLGCGLIIG